MEGTAEITAPGPDATPEEVQAWRAQQAEARMQADGASTAEVVQVDYFGFEDTKLVNLPDGVSWVEITAMNEGARQKYLKAVQGDVRIQKATGDLVTRMSAGAERVELLRQSITNWNLVRRDRNSGELKPLVFNESNLRQFLDTANPKLLDLIEKEVRKFNPWLLADLSVEEIEKQIEELTEMRDAKIKEEEGNAGS